MFIVDLGLSNNKVINNIEYIYNHLQSFWPEKRVVFLDSSGVWNEIITDCDSNVKGMYPVLECYTYFVSYKEHIPDLPSKCTFYII